MRIKTWVNNKVRKFVAKKWPHKKVNCNYKNDSWRMRDCNRWIQVSTPIDDEYIHYEIIENYVAVHFEYSDSKDKGITAHADLVDYLEKETESIDSYEWTDFLDGDSVACIYKDRIVDWDDMLEKLKSVVEFFDPLIEKHECQIGRAHV